MVVKRVNECRSLVSLALESVNVVVVVNINFDQLIFLLVCHFIRQIKTYFSGTYTLTLSFLSIYEN
jgi:hypothetical protein